MKAIHAKRRGAAAWRCAVAVRILVIYCVLWILFGATAATAAQTEKEGGKRSIGAVPTVEFDWFWLFYERERAGSTSTMVLRPFYLKHGTNDSYFQASLMPFLFWRYRTPGYDKWKWLFGLGQVDDVRRGDTRDFDFGFFPLLFFGFGSAAARENYFFLWPIGGTLKGKFVTDKISAYLFPGVLLFVFFPPATILSYKTLAWGVISLLPAYFSYEAGDFHAWGLFWPVFHYGKGGLREEFRLLPFYSHFVKRGWYDKYSFLFVINYQRYYYAEDLHQTFFLFPLFGRKWSRSRRMSAVTILWPFFSWGYDKRIGDWELNIPWPLVQFKDCENPKIRKRIFFPVYGHYRYVNNETVFITPLYFRLTKKSYRFDSQQHIAFLVFWFYRRDYHRSVDSYYGKRWRYFKLWPIFSIEYNDLGDRAFNLLALLPFRDRQGYERLYQPFWSIIEYERFRSGERRLGLLLRLYRQRWGDTFFHFKVPFLISAARRENRLTELTFFEHMFGYQMKPGGRYMRLFWIPIRIGEPVATRAGGDGDDLAEGMSLAGSGSLLLIERPLEAAVATRRFSWR
ncbi:MAG: hypothetical protein JW838_03325 [Spirochaetes bacterium]|nr:hypothetical protein [Spirochaetota bacterium]